MKPGPGSWSASRQMRSEVYQWSAQILARCRIVKRLVDALPSGSYLAMSHPTAEVHAEAIETSIAQYHASGAPPIRTRSREELVQFFDGLDLLEPGVVSCSLWRPDPTDIGVIAQVTQYGGLTQKP